MGKNKDCFYCMADERRDKLMIEIAKLSASSVFLFKEQTYPGRCIVAHDDHVRELYELGPSELAAFMSDVSQVAAAIARAFGPDKLNYGAYGDKMPHLHMHIVPKYDGQTSWGSTFEMNPGKVYLTDEQYQAMIDKIRQYL